MTTIRIGTRASALAMWQAEHVQRLLKDAWPEIETVLVPMTTTGDRILDRPLAAIGGKGLFVKELEHGMLEGQIDIAVHSMKDMPTEQPPGLVLDVVVPRAPAFDVLCGATKAFDLQSLPQCARVGTGSQRRRAQLLLARPDLEIVPLRGNVITRLEKRYSEKLDAIVLAEAGLHRLGIWEESFTRIDPVQMIPAPGQGAVVIERRQDDGRLAALLAPLHCPKTSLAVEVERACLRGIGGDCHTPFAAWARFEDNTLHVDARLFREERYAEVRRQDQGAWTTWTTQKAEELGRSIAAELLRSFDHEDRETR